MEMKKYFNMKKITTILILFFPLFGNAQLDKITPGMSLEEFRKQFPLAIHDEQAMSSWVHADTIIEGLKGRSRYLVKMDTVSEYDFWSEEINGPCEGYKGNQAAYDSLLKAAENLKTHYTKLFGAPSFFRTADPSVITEEKVPSDNFISKWETKNYELSVRIYLSTSYEHEINPEVGTEEKTGCKMVLQISAEGKGNYLSNEFGVGMTGDEFKKFKPSLANQVEKKNDCWQTAIYVNPIHANLNDIEKEGTWKFVFANNKLIGFSFYMLDGQKYGDTRDSAYAYVRRRALQLESEAEKLYGKPDSSSVDFPKQRISNQPYEGFVRVTFYRANWQFNNQKFFIEAKEFGGGMGGPTTFLLKLNFGETEELFR
jgi:hypothetical protein